jgi:hypothetical protein
MAGLVPAIHGFLVFPISGKTGAASLNFVPWPAFPFSSKRRETEMVATSEIREHMEVIGADGEHVGTVDHMDNGRIKLTKSDSSDGQHHYLDMGLVDHIDDHVHLNVSAEDAMNEWSGDDLELEDDDASTVADNDDTFMKEKLDGPR